MLNGSEYFHILQGDVPELLLSRNAHIDYETDPDIWVRLLCTDSGRPPLNIERSFHIVVTDRNEALTQVVFEGRETIPENIPSGTVLGNLTVVDEDIGQSYLFRVIGRWASAFKVVIGDCRYVLSDAFATLLCRYRRDS